MPVSIFRRTERLSNGFALYLILTKATWFMGVLRKLIIHWKLSNQCRRGKGSPSPKFHRKVILKKDEARYQREKKS